MQSILTMPVLVGIIVGFVVASLLFGLVFVCAGTTSIVALIKRRDAKIKSGDDEVGKSKVLTRTDEDKLRNAHEILTASASSLVATLKSKNQFLRKRVVRTIRESLDVVESEIKRSGTPRLQNLDLAGAIGLDGLGGTQVEDTFTVVDHVIVQSEQSEAEEKAATALLESITDKADALALKELLDPYRYDHPCFVDFTPAEKRALWKNRDQVIRVRKLFTMLIRSVDWNDVLQAGEAEKLITSLLSSGKKKRLPFDLTIEDALFLLNASCAHPRARSFGLAILKQLPDEEIEEFLLQLLQALRYEQSDSQPAKQQPQSSPLEEFLLEKSSANFEIANKLNWLLTVEGETENQHSELFKSVHYRFLQKLREIKGKKADYLQRIVAQQRLVGKLMELGTSLKADKKSKRAQKIITMRDALLLIGKELFGEKNTAPICLPLQPSTQVTQFLSNECSLFSSAMQPMLLSFSQKGSKLPHKAIFKHGDDLRQDQMVLGLIEVMDRCLKMHGLDLFLTPYRVLATGPNSGFVEFVPSESINGILNKYKGGIPEYLRSETPCAESHHADKLAGIDAAVIDRYCRSCAGYAVISFILGVGDRHLDNLLITKDGRLFHIDFGFILGCDPKPLPPPMRLCFEMVDGFGGIEGPHFSSFRSFCATAFLILRQYSRLIINMLALMIDAQIPNLVKQRKTKIRKVLNKFRLDLDDDAAIKEINRIIDVSIHEIMPHLTETIHKLVQEFKS